MRVAPAAGWRTIHPGVVVSVLIAHGILSFLWESPILLIGQLLFLVGWAYREQALDAMRLLFWMMAWLAPFFLLINALFSSNGLTYLWRGPSIPVIGRLDLTVEELAYSSIGLVRLSILLLLSGLFQRLVDHDRFLFLFARLAPRFVLTAVIAIRLFPQLAEEAVRIKEAAAIRGIRPPAKSRLAQLRYYWLLLKPLLFSALEGSWQTAESLYARGFGSGPRTLYQPRGFSTREKLAISGSGCILGFALFGKALSFGQMQYYPRMLLPDGAGDLLFLAVLTLTWFIPLYVLKRREFS